MRSHGRIFLALCLAGFIGGILYANTGARDHILAAGIFSDYFLEQYTQAEIQTQDYFWYILWVRAGMLVAISLLGQMKGVRRWIVAAVLVWTGFLGGLFFTASVIKLGPAGILFCLAAVLPQALFYIAGYGIVLWYFYSYPRSSWNYSKTVGTILTIGVGIISESYLNPIFLKIFLKTI